MTSGPKRLEGLADGAGRRRGSSRRPRPAGAGVGASGRRERSSLASSLLPVVAGHVGVAPGLLAEPVEELAEGVVVGVGVLAYVHGGELEAEGGEGADACGPGGRRRTRPPRCSRSEVWIRVRSCEQLGGAEVVAAGLVRGALGEALAGVDELLPDAGGLEAVGLLGVEPLVAGADLGQPLQVAPGGSRGVPRWRRCSGWSWTGAPRSSSMSSRASVMPCSCWRIRTSQVTCGGDVGVAVAVAADPGAEGERAGAGGQLRRRPAPARRRGPRGRRRRRRRAARRGSRWRCGPRRRARGARRAARRSARRGRCSRRGAGRGGAGRRR